MALVSMSATDSVLHSLLGGNVGRLLRRMVGQKAESSSVTLSPAAVGLRRSNALREFCQGVESPPGLQILDLGSASQANVSFITSLGHKLYTEDLFRQVGSPQARDTGAEEPGWEEDRFFCENLNYAEGQFDGILCWDLFDFLADPLVKPLVERLYRCLKPGGSLLTFFRTSQPGHEVPIFQYRICSHDSLQVVGRGVGTLRRHYHNRTIETLFRRFASLKFYLARDNLREVIVVR